MTYILVVLNNNTIVHKFIQSKVIVETAQTESFLHYISNVAKQYINKIITHKKYENNK